MKLLSKKIFKMKSDYIKMEVGEVNMFLMKILTEPAPEISRTVILFLFCFSERKSEKVLKQAMCGTQSPNASY